MNGYESKMEKKSIKELSLPRRPPKNPIPSLSEGGDCGACVLAGILNISIQEAYDLHCSGDYYGGTPIPKVSSFNFRSMTRTLESLTDDIGFRDTDTPLEHCVVDIPMWTIAQHHEVCGMSFGVSGAMQYSPWCNMVRSMIIGGYYGICQVFDGGHKVLNNLYGTTNHWIMIAGWRYVYIKHTNHEVEGTATGHYEQEILIGNSSNANPQEEWLPADDFLKNWGGFGVLWAKPLDKK